MRVALKAQQVDKSILGLTFLKPLTDFECPNIGFLLTAYRYYKDHGGLTFEGPLADQPNKIMEVFNVLTALENKALEDEVKKQNRINGKKRS